MYLNLYIKYKYAILNIQNAKGEKNQCSNNFLQIAFIAWQDSNCFSLTDKQLKANSDKVNLWTRKQRHKGKNFKKFDISNNKKLCQRYFELKEFILTDLYINTRIRKSHIWIFLIFINTIHFTDHSNPLLVKLTSNHCYFYVDIMQSVKKGFLENISNDCTSNWIIEKIFTIFNNASFFFNVRWIFQGIFLIAIQNLAYCH